MTTEQKAKAYDEALEWMRKVYPTLTGVDKEDAGHYFPELKESEDERIGNVIYCIVRDNKEVKRILEGNGVSVDNALAYLEKQKEQKPAEWSEEDLQHKSWILECLADGERKMPEYAEDFRAAYKWIKSLRPKPHWKPSEEQMEELNKVRTLNPGLDALYQQLKNM